jgi:hypothetical protein
VHERTLVSQDIVVASRPLRRDAWSGRSSRGSEIAIAVWLVTFLVGVLALYRSPYGPTSARESSETGSPTSAHESVEAPWASGDSAPFGCGKGCRASLRLDRE